MVDGTRINSCLAFAVQYEGAEITTIEGLAENDALHPLLAQGILFGASGQIRNMATVGGNLLASDSLFLFLR